MGGERREEEKKRKERVSSWRRMEYVACCSRLLVDLLSRRLFSSRMGLNYGDRTIWII